MFMHTYGISIETSYMYHITNMVKSWIFHFQFVVNNNHVIIIIVRVPKIIFFPMWKVCVLASLQNLETLNMCHQTC
jgi:hypothetical protein